MLESSLGAAGQGSPPQFSSAMTLAFISIIAVATGVLLVFGLGFGALYLLWTILQPPDPPEEPG
jgi:hypothetical protein